MKFNLQFWLKFSLINLCLVAFIGTVMRYKIGFEFPFLNQKNLQHSHSHFAFAGWVSHTLMVLMVYYLNSKLPKLQTTKYKYVIIANLIVAYGMLISFIYQGYAMFSITFSTLSIVISYFFAYFYYKDLKSLAEQPVAVKWFKASLLFLVISSIGTFSLAYMMATKTMTEQPYLASIYYYLHFQYNGWFFFVCMGLLYDFLNLNRQNKFFISAYQIFAFTCIPTYILSVLWLKLPLWLLIFTALCAFMQLYAWIHLVFIIVKTKLYPAQSFSKWLNIIAYLVAFSLSLKLVLQLASTIPALSTLTQSFRPIVIAYLHLVLLAVISLFLLYYIYAKRFFNFTKSACVALVIFTIAVFLNEFVLGVQGIAAFSYTLIPYVNESLFAIALLLFGSMLALFFNSKKQVN
ncbi:MAG: hypothetical protein ACOH1O_02760 [Flavobacterium sp.]